MSEKTFDFETELSALAEGAKKYGVPVTRPLTREFLSETIRKKSPKFILEIGTAVGVSAIEMLHAAGSDCKLVSIEHNHELAEIAKNNLLKFKLANRARIVEGDCLVELCRLALDSTNISKFDMIFLDGPKAQYLNMFELLMLLLNSGGVFICDDVLFHDYYQGNKFTQSKRYKTIVKRLDEFIKKCKNSPKLTKFELKTIEDGIIYAEKV